MSALTFITDETHDRRYVQIDLAEIENEQLEEMMDIIIAEARKDNEKIKIEDLENELKAEGYL